MTIYCIFTPQEIFQMRDAVDSIGEAAVWTFWLAIGWEQADA